MIEPRLNELKTDLKENKRELINAINRVDDKIGNTENYLDNKIENTRKELEEKVNSAKNNLRGWIIGAMAIVVALFCAIFSKI